jgi:succinate dehydrogenase / fumarate reductase, cytochrome b subunit
LIVAGNVSFPIAVMAGIVEYDPSAVSEPVESES